MKVLKAGTKTIEGIKPFRLVKYLSLTSLMVISGLYASPFRFYLPGSEEDPFPQEEQYALLVAENLNHQVSSNLHCLP